MNQAPGYVEAEAQEPQDENNGEDGPKHCRVSSAYVETWDVVGCNRGAPDGFWLRLAFGFGLGAAYRSQERVSGRWYPHAPCQYRLRLVFAAVNCARGIIVAPHRCSF